MFLEIFDQPLITFKCPEGTFTVTCQEVKPAGTKTATSHPVPSGVRFVFCVDELSNEHKHVLVGRTFAGNDDGRRKMNTFLNDWFGAENLQKMLQGKQLDATTLIGLKAVVDVTHYQNASHNEPFVSVAKIYPHGQRVKTK